MRTRHCSQRDMPSPQCNDLVRDNPQQRLHALILLRHFAAKLLELLQQLLPTGTGLGAGVGCGGRRSSGIFPCGALRFLEGPRDLQKRRRSRGSIPCETAAMGREGRVRHGDDAVDHAARGLWSHGASAEEAIRGGREAAVGAGSIRLGSKRCAADGRDGLLPGCVANLQPD